MYAFVTSYIVCGFSFCCASCCFLFKQKTAYEMRISDWSSDVCSSDLLADRPGFRTRRRSIGAVPGLGFDVGHLASVFLTWRSIRRIGTARTARNTKAIAEASASLKKRTPVWYIKNWRLAVGPPGPPFVMTNTYTKSLAEIGKGAVR